jgi:signal peptidase
MTRDRERNRSWIATGLNVALLAVLVPLATFLVAAWLLGWQLQSVLSGSMAPTYPVGSLLVVAPLDASDVRPGMPIVFEDPRVRGRIVTHRVVGVAPGETLQFWTQGDANASRDPVPVPARMVRGRVLWQVSYVGGLLTLLQWPWSFLALVVAPGLLLIGGELRNRWRAKAGSPSDSRAAEARPSGNAEDHSAA